MQKVDAERWNEIAKETVASLQGHVIKRLRPRGPNHGVSNERCADFRARQHFRRTTITDVSTVSSEKMKLVMSKSDGRAMDTTEESFHDLVSDGDNHEFEMTIRQSRRRKTQQESFDDWHEESARLQPHTHTLNVGHVRPHSMPMSPKEYGVFWQNAGWCGICNDPLELKRLRVMSLFSIFQEQIIDVPDGRCTRQPSVQSLTHMYLFSVLSSCVHTAFSASLSALTRFPLL